jgi:hypothetical protein
VGSSLPTSSGIFNVRSGERLGSVTYISGDEMADHGKVNRRTFVVIATIFPKIQLVGEGTGFATSCQYWTQTSTWELSDPNRRRTQIVEYDAGASQVILHGRHFSTKSANVLIVHYDAVWRPSIRLMNLIVSEEELPADIWRRIQESDDGHEFKNWQVY